MIFKEGNGWKCCYDPETDRYTAKTGSCGNIDLYEITKEIYEKVDDPSVEWPTILIHEGGRHLFMSVDDRCGPPYTVILDEDYEKICPWASVNTTGKVWPKEMTDAVVELFESEKDNREQRRAKKAEREKKKKSDDE